MDYFSKVYSHQIGIVNELSKSFDQVTVLTGKIGAYKVSSNVKVYSSNWQTGRRIYSSAKFLFIFLKIFATKRFTGVFSHMTSVQAALISPLTKFFKVKHILWYTHTADNFALRVCLLFTNRVLTATSGAFPNLNSKVYAIGHSIDSVVFSRRSRVTFPLNRFVHIGRFDPIKKIEDIISALDLSKTEGLSLTLIGSPSSSKNTEYQETIIENFSNTNGFGWIKFLPSINRSEIPDTLENFDVFIHACNAGLDKAILEATFVGLPVVTTNREYLKIFGSWNLKNDSTEYTLLEEIKFLLKIDKAKLITELDRRYEIALNKCEIKAWTRQVVEIFNS